MTALKRHIKVLFFGLFASFLLTANAVPVSAQSTSDLPDELFEALKIGKDASPKELYDALAKRYYDPEQGYGKGSHADLWEPIPITKYLAPSLFYKPPAEAGIGEANRAQCVECHTSITPGWVHAWKKSDHANLDEIRGLPDSDVRAYKKKIITDVETNLRSLGMLEDGKTLAEVGCIDCHIGPNKQTGNHDTELKLPDAAACGQCHLQEFAERESERDTITWPQGQWPKGRPSHALDYKANVETGIWAAMSQREVAEGCTFCHINQNKCDTCHTRHEFSTVEARKPEACSICHNGVDHNEFENYLLSKHGTIYQTRGDTWNWQARLADAMTKGNMHAPTCVYCHMEYQGEFSHNLVRKVRWGFNPTPKIADNLKHEWFEKRKEDWKATCANCHSGSFADAYLEYIDKGTIDGLNVEQEARKVIGQLYKDGLLVGQKTNRPKPPKPVEEKEAGQFFGLFWAKGNNPSKVEYEFAELWEHHLIKHYKGLAHANPGGYTYSEGWSQILKSYARIQDENTRLREMADLKSQVAKLVKQQRGDLWDFDRRTRRASIGIVGMLLVLVGGLWFLLNRRRRRSV